MEVDEKTVNLIQGNITSGDKSISLEEVCYAVYTRAYDVIFP